MVRSLRNLNHLIALAALLLTLAASIAMARRPAWPTALAAAPAPPACVGREIYEISVLRREGERFVHVPSAIALKDGRLRAFWYEGTQELAPDVRIMTSTSSDGGWSPPTAIADLRQTRRDTGRFTRKLGNPLVYRDAGGALVMLYVSTLGGWSSASLNVMRSIDEGENWSSAGRLITSPLFNISTLVRSPVVAMSGGETLVPAYDEATRHYPIVMLFDRNGQVGGLRRIGNHTRLLQPHLLGQEGRSMRAYMRVRASTRPEREARAAGLQPEIEKSVAARMSQSGDAGFSWSTPTATNIPAHNNPIAIERLSPKELLLAYNEQLRADGGAGQLTLALSSDDGAHWRVVHSIGEDTHTVRYPWLMTGPDGSLHLFHSRHGNQGGDYELVHTRISRDWLAARGGSPCN